MTRRPVSQTRWSPDIADSVGEIETVRKRVTTQTIRARKGTAEPVTLVTAYDYPMARWADQAGIDIVMVSDAFASVGLGRENTLSVTVDETIHHTRAVVAGAGASLVVATMPFMSYVRGRDALDNAARLVKEGGARAIEVEGDASAAPTVAALHENGIPVIAHVGLTKIVSSRSGSYRTLGRTPEEAAAIIDDAVAMQKAGAFAVLVECVPDRLADIITKRLDVPTIGIGAGPYCDGQALVSQDMLGMFDKFCPKFVKRYAKLGDMAIEAFAEFRADVVAGRFPAEEHTVHMDKDALSDLAKSLKPQKK